MTAITIFISACSLLITSAGFFYNRLGDYRNRVNSALDPFGIDELALVTQNVSISERYREAAKIELERKLTGLDLRASISNLVFIDKNLEILVDEFETPVNEHKKVPIDDSVKNRLRINQGLISKIKEDKDLVSKKWRILGDFPKSFIYYLYLIVGLPILLMIVIAAFIPNSLIGYPLWYIILLRFILITGLLAAVIYIVLVKLLEYINNYQYYKSLEFLTHKTFEPTWFQNIKLKIGRKFNTERAKKWTRGL